MISTTSLRRAWLPNVRGGVLAGLVVALALIPEATGFSIITGVDPRVGLYAPFTIAVLIGPLVRDHGVEYLFAATVVMGGSRSLPGSSRSTG